MILAQREMLAEREAALTEAQSEAKVRALEIERLKLQLAKARREHFRPVVGARQASRRAARTGDRGPGRDAGRGRDQGRDRGARDRQGAAAASAARTAQASGQSAGRARRRACAVRLRQVRRRPAAQARRGGVEDARMRAAALEDHRAGAREVRLPGLRGRHRAAGAVASDPARLRRPEPARHDPGRQVRRPSAAEPAERRLRPRGRRNRGLDARRLGRRMRRRPRTHPRRASPRTCSPPSACMSTTRP